MLNFLSHCFQFAEVYAVMLVWLVIPLGYYAFYLFFRTHYGMFEPTVKKARLKTETLEGKESKGHGANRSAS